MRLAILLVLFFASGLCGLLYQVLWLRLLALVFGVTVYAASTVLAAFMTGLALGSAAASRVLATIPRPLFVFGVAEILVGLSALATPLLFDAATALYQRLYPSTDSFAVLTAARLAGSFLVLLIPTFLMGMTLPVLSASSLVQGSRFGSRVSALYAINTAGGVCGALVAGFFLIGSIGIQRSFLVGAAVNVLVGLAALVLERRVPSTVTRAATSDQHAAAPEVSVARAPSTATLTAIAALSGFLALTLEIVWFRTLVQYLAATTYAFTAMLVAVLVGIAAGSGLSARLLLARRDWTAWAYYLQLLTAITVLAAAAFLGWSYRGGWRTSGEWQASAVAILPASLLMGLSFPILIHLATSTAGHSLPQYVARLYSFNVCGGIVGALVGGFLLVPALGTRWALIAAAAGYGAGALLLLLRGRRDRIRLAGAFVAATLLFVYAARVTPDPFAAAYARRYGADMREFWREEGAQTAVSVHASQFRRSLYLDGLHQANDTPDMVRLHRIIGHLPMVLHPRPTRALVIGLGGGATAGAVSQYPDAEVQVVELSESVRKAASFFAHVNYDILNRPNVDVRVDDGRNFLLLSGRTFDVVTADVIQPIHAGAGNVYSREYFTLVRNALAPGGLVMQWIGHRPRTQYALIMRTFLDVFPHATLWFDGNLMVGSVAPLALSATTLVNKRASAVTAAALDEIGLTSYETLVSWYTAGPEQMRRFVGPGLLLTDDRPLLEYHRSLPVDDAPLDLSTLKAGG